MTPRETLTAAMADLGLTVEAVFVPWKESRNYDPLARPEDPTARTLNWRVTLHKAPQVGGLYSPGDTRALAGGKLAPPTPILTTDYSAGIAHCPAYKASVKDLGGRGCIMRAEAIIQETDTGRAALPRFTANPARILPDPADVVWALVSDADVLNAGGFESWALEMGYDTDSRKAAATYKACLEIALKLRAGIGDAGIAKLLDAARDY